MGVNARFSDVESELIERATRSRENYDRDLRERIRAGEISVLDYLMRYKGFSKDHAERLRPRFEGAILG